MTAKVKLAANLEKKSHFLWFFEAIDNYVEAKNLKHTKQRKTIAACLLGLKKKHIDIEELHKILKQQGHAIGIATVYRTMSLFKDAGLLEQKNFGENRSVYEIAFPHKHHDHIICVDCQHVFEFEDEKLEQLKEQIAANMGFVLKSHQLDLFGSCTRQNCPHRLQTS